MKKKKNTSKKTQSIRSNKSQHEEFKLLWWSPTLSRVFVLLLIITLIILVALTYVQYKYIEQLENKKNDVNIVEDFSYEVQALEDYMAERDLTPSIADIYQSFVSDGYEDIILQEGFVQGEKKICDSEGCFKKTIRFNQRKGKYIEYIYEK